MCDQQRLRPASAYPQSDQSLCKLLEYSMNVQLMAEQHLEFLSLKGSCTGCSGSKLVKMSHCWKSHVTAHLPFLSGPPLAGLNCQHLGILGEEYQSLNSGNTSYLIPENIIY